MVRERNIEYTGRDFNSLREQLVEFAKNYFPDTYTDFTATSPGMMFMEMAAYVGDVLSFYQDKQLQETFLQYARNSNNLYSLAYMMGYRPKVTSVSTTDLTVTQVVPAVLSSGEYVPDFTSAIRLGEGSQIISSVSGSISFLTQNPVDFRYSSSFDPTDIQILDLDSSGKPDRFTLSKKVKAYSGTIKTARFSFGPYKKYQTVEINDQNIVGILDAYEAGTGDRWYEVPFLGQDTVFVDSENTNSDANQAPYVLRLQKVPRRFVSRFKAKDTLQLQFGAGMYADDADEKNFLPNPVSLENTDQELLNNRYDVAYDPSNFLFSKSYGLAPVNKDIVVRYIVGGGVSSNVEAYTLTRPGTLNIPFGADASTLSFYNEEASVGGSNGDEIEDIRQNAMRSFAEQKRMVTLNDFNVRALAMPAKYGAVAKAYAANGSSVQFNGATSILNQNPLAISLYTLGYDGNGKLKALTPTMKENLKTYLSEYLMLTDAVDIKDAFIINIGVRYDIVLRPNYRSSDVLIQCSRALQDYFKTSNRSINETINLSEIYSLLDQIQGIQTVKSVEIYNKYGNEYSPYSYDIQAATSNNIIYPSYDISIFEVKYPEVDIEGRVVTL